MTSAVEMAESDFDLSARNIANSAKDANMSSKDFFNTYLAPYLKVSSITEGNYKFGNESYDLAITFDDGTKMYSKSPKQSAGVAYTYDVNGDKGPNEFGRDLYYFSMGCDSIFKCGEKSFSPLWVWSVSSETREDILKMCNTYSVNRGLACAYLLEADGWEYKDDYPFKL